MRVVNGGARSFTNDPQGDFGHPQARVPATLVDRVMFEGLGRYPNVEVLRPNYVSDRIPLVSRLSLTMSLVRARTRPVCPRTLPPASSSDVRVDGHSPESIWGSISRAFHHPPAGSWSTFAMILGFPACTRCRPGTAICRSGYPTVSAVSSSCFRRRTERKVEDNIFVSQLLHGTFRRTLS